MRTKFVFGLVALLLGALGFKHAQNAPDLSSPRATVLSMITAYGHHDSAGMAKCIEGGVSGELPAEMLIAEITSYTSAEKDQIIEITGDSARVAVKYEVGIALRGGVTKSTVIFVDMFALHKSDAGWLIVPEKLSNEAGGTLPLATRPLSLIASLLGPDPGYRNALTRSKKQAAEAGCLSNTKEIALGTLMYVQDYDEVLPRSAAGYNRLIAPYVKNDDMFRCAQDAKGTISYSMNVNLQNRSFADVENPARTVLFYEGKNGVVNYRHEGRAAIATVDGHAKLMTETEVKALIWKLAPPVHKKVPTKKRKH